MELSVFVLVISFVLLLTAGVPIAFSIGAATMFTMLCTMPAGPALTTVAQRMAAGIDSFALLAIPFFILSGQLMGKGGIARRLIGFAKVLVGRMPGGLAYVNIMACMFFGAISGSAVAATSAIGGFMIPVMNDEGYDPVFNTAVTVSGSVTGLLIPPSNVLIVYALASGGTSIAALFMGGYLPGILLGVSMMTVCAVTAAARKYPTGEGIRLGESLRRFLAAVPSLFLVVIVIGGIVSGVFTATEASAVAVIYSLILSLAVYREIGIRDLPRICIKTVETTAIVMLLVAASSAMSWILSYENIPQNISNALLSATDSRILILLMINLILLLVGTFMDMTPAVLIFTPIFLPVAVEMGMSPLHFGIMMVLNLCIGLCTPPVGSVLFVGCGIGNTTIGRLSRLLLPFYLVMILVLMLVTYLPWLSESVPALFGL